MAIVMRMEAPGATVEQYEALNEVIGVDDDNPPDGLVIHVAGVTDDGMVVIDVWESEEKLNAFFDIDARPGARGLGDGARAADRLEAPQHDPAGRRHGPQRDRGGARRRGLATSTTTWSARCRRTWATTRHIPCPSTSRA